MMSNKVSYEEQIEMGLVRPKDNFIPAIRGEVLRPSRPLAPVDTNSIIQFDSQPGATSHIEVKTSFLDRAKGFTLMTSQLSLLYGAAFVVIGRVVADIPIFSIWGLLMFLIAYSVTWGIAYMQTLHFSPEGIQARESDKKLSIIEMDVRKRWEMLERDQAEAIRERREDRLEARTRRLGDR
jgi:hypothetical protein